MKAYCTDYGKLSVEHRQTTYRYHLGRSLKLSLLRFLLEEQNKNVCYNSKTECRRNHKRSFLLLDVGEIAVGMEDALATEVNAQG